MRDVHLVRLDPAVEEAFINDAEYMRALAADDWPTVAACVHRRVGRTLPAGTGAGQPGETHWGAFCVVDAATREVVGSCAFKGPPTEAGTVEIAYFTYPGFERRGYATAMAARLVALAGGSGRVRRVIAHTMPERNASSRVLEKVGMHFDGEVVDPEDGRVWRWQMTPGRART